MSSDKAALDSLRIDRTTSARRNPSWIAPVLVVILLVGGGVFWWLKQPKAAAVETAVARAQASNGGGVQRTLLNASGYVTARRAATVSSKVTGKVVEVLVEEGMKVEAGQVLARLDCIECRGEPAAGGGAARVGETPLEETKPNLDVRAAGVEALHRSRRDEGGERFGSCAKRRWRRGRLTRGSCARRRRSPSPSARSSNGSSSSTTPSSARRSPASSRPRTRSPAR